MGAIVGNVFFSVTGRYGNNFQPTGSTDGDIPQPLYRSCGIKRSSFRSKPDIQISSVKAEQESFSDAARCRILLIGNERHDRQAMRSSLSEQLNFTFDYFEAWNGEIALQIMGKEAIDLIVLRNDIASLNDLVFLERLNMELIKSEIPVIKILNADSSNAGLSATTPVLHDYLLKDSDSYHFELLPVMVSRTYAELQTKSVLRQTADGHQAITESLPSVIYQLPLQEDRHDVHISRQIAELGISADKWGRDAELHHQMCHEDDRALVKQALEHSYKTGAMFQCEYRINAQGNTVRWFYDKARVVMDKHDQPLMLQGVMTDITSVKVLEAELMQYRYMFEEMLRQRTEQLDRRVAILTSCNSKLCDESARMREMYLDLLSRVQADETRASGFSPYILVNKEE